MEKTLAGSQPLICFVLELVSSGYFGDQIGVSFRSEGRAMLDAVLEDLRSIPHVAAETIEAAACDGDTLRQRVAGHRAHATLIIAPEFDGLLEEFCRDVSRPGVMSLNCDQTALALCSDKWRWAQHLAAHQIPTIATQLQSLEAEPVFFPCVVKPRDGAGSWLVRLIRSPADWQRAAAEFRAAGRAEFLCQPFLVGESYSIAAMIRAGHPAELLPIAEQRLSDEGEFRYLGGSIPADISQPVRWSIQQLVSNCLTTIPGLNGYVGCDVIVPADRPETPLLVEINPRMTTSYIGYRRLCADNLMERLLFPDRLDRPLRWRTGAVSFDAGGLCDYCG